MIQKSSAHLLALSALKPLVEVQDASSNEAIVSIKIHDKRFAMYEVYRRNFTLGEKYFAYVGSVVNGERMIYDDSGAQLGHALQFTVTGLDAAGNRSSAFITDVVIVGAQ